MRVFGEYVGRMGGRGGPGHMRTRAEVFRLT